MNRNGFTMVEIVVVVAVMATLLTIATLNFNSMTTKANIDAEARMLYTDLMTARAQALYTRSSQAIVLGATSFAAYSSAVSSGTPVVSKSLRFPIETSGVTAFNFDGSGVAVTTAGAIIDPALVICLLPNDNRAGVDSVVVESTRIRLGKRQTGAGCIVDNITYR